MAVTATLAKATPHCLVYSVVHDGAGGDALVLDNATMLADALAGPLRELLSEVFNPNSQATARARMLGDASGLADQDLTNIPHCHCYFTNQIQGAAVASQSVAVVDADVDAVAGGNFELNLQMSTGNAATALLKIEFQHTIDR